MNYKTFIEKYKVDCNITRVPFRTDHITDWGTGARHFMYTIKVRGTYDKTVNGYFSQGSAHKKCPTCVDILNALSLDTNGIHGTSFDIWCGDFGYDSDSIKALETYRACLNEYKQLEQVFNKKQLKELYGCEAL